MVSFATMQMSKNKYSFKLNTLNNNEFFNLLNIKGCTLNRLIKYLCMFTSNLLLLLSSFDNTLLDDRFHGVIYIEITLSGL